MSVTFSASIARPDVPADITVAASVANAIVKAAKDANIRGFIYYDDPTDEYFQGQYMSDVAAADVLTAIADLDLPTNVREHLAAAADLGVQYLVSQIEFGPQCHDYRLSASSSFGDEPELNVSNSNGWSIAKALGAETPDPGCCLGDIPASAVLAGVDKVARTLDPRYADSLEAIAHYAIAKGGPDAVVVFG